LFRFDKNHKDVGEFNNIDSPFVFVDPETVKTMVSSGMSSLLACVVLQGFTACPAQAYIPITPASIAPIISQAVNP
jgi:hypothetical protein